MTLQKEIEAVTRKSVSADQIELRPALLLLK